MLIKTTAPEFSNLSAEGTCFCNTIQSADSRLVGPGVKVQFDGKCLTSSHNQAVYAIEICAVFHVVILALQVTVVDIQNCTREREFPYVRDYMSQLLVCAGFHPPLSSPVLHC